MHVLHVHVQTLACMQSLISHVMTNMPCDDKYSDRQRRRIPNAKKTMSHVEWQSTNILNRRRKAAGRRATSFPHTTAAPVQTGLHDTAAGGIRSDHTSACERCQTLVRNPCHQAMVAEPRFGALVALTDKCLPS